MKLSTSELEIMQQIWAQGGAATASELTGLLQEKGWKPTTLLTFLARMVNKKALVVQKQGKQNRYTACVTGEEYRAGETKELLDKFYSGNVKSMVTALYQGEVLDAAELQELRDWLEKR